MAPGWGIYCTPKAAGAKALPTVSPKLAELKVTPELAARICLAKVI